MSIFTRPASPPPRQPSPELLYSPLPLRSRNRTLSNSQPRPAPKKPILTVRSYNDLASRAIHSPPPTPRSLPPTLTPDYHHRRTLSNAIPYRSPPPSPTISSPPPPVPPIPAFVLSPPDNPRSRNLSSSKKPSLKPRIQGITCLRFFSIRNNAKQHPPPPSPLMYNSSYPQTYTLVPYPPLEPIRLTR
ncbi:hypothetical protein H0H92_014479 [Tricholoma furcatifolium]|nr:hypothetical protein H0H92_014479 [Tricholoma furcatifolium]